MDQNEAIIDQNRPFWSILFSRMPKYGSEKGHLTKMVVWNILDHIGPVHFPTVPRPRPRRSGLTQ